MKALRAGEIFRWLAVMFMALILSCDESLPDRQVPSFGLLGKTNWLAQTSLDDSSLVASFTIVNLYDDVVDGTASFNGSIDIVVVNEFGARKHAILTAGHVTSARGFNPATKHLTIDPGDSIQLQYRWDVTDDAGNNLASTEDVDGLAFLLRQDLTCSWRWLGGPTTFAVSGQMIVFQNLGPVVFPNRMFSLCYMKIIGSKTACSPVVFPNGCP